ncbi:hypothetical protein AwWohl_10690 [Gammaproteobacteria bacterium]|nr:hypothetical protein AwWohl_10690 [Gammaproteobacteria bacterium]
MRIQIIVIIMLSLLNQLSLAKLSDKTPNNAEQLVQKARLQVTKTIYYDPAYIRLDYPNGDVPLDRGVCTDVIIRALRDAFKYDLQEKIHEDMRQNFSKYPKIWKAKKTDRNIDHRRVPNIETFLTRLGKNIAVTKNAEDYHAGDIVSVRLNNITPHIFIISDKRSQDGIRPLIIHNIGAGTQEEDQLFKHPITGHFRFLGQ